MVSKIPRVFDECLLAHAERYWDAERENAARLTTRAGVTMTALGALFGLGLYRIEWFRGYRDVLRTESICAAMSVKFMLIVGLLFFVSAFLLMVRSSRLRLSQAVTAAFGNGDYDGVFYGTAADKLGLSPDEIKNLPKMNDVSARQLVFVHVYRAADSLRKMNIIRAKHLHRANLMFSFGLICVSIAVLLYILNSEPAMIN